MATCFCISGTFSDLDCDDVYAFADGLRVIATLGTAERCASLMDGDSLDIIDPAQYSKISLQPGPSGPRMSLRLNRGDQHLLRHRVCPHPDPDDRARGRRHADEPR